MDRMVTDTATLLAEGLGWPRRPTRRPASTLGWAGCELDEYVLHQVSNVHTTALVDLLGIDPARVLTTFPEYGNVGPASVPLTLSKLQRGRPADARATGWACSASVLGSTARWPRSSGEAGSVSR